MYIYNKLYKKNKNVFGEKTDPLIKRALQYIKSKNKGLDLGCGQGKDVFYLSKKGFNMTAVDLSKIAIQQIKNKVRIQGINNIKAKQADVSYYTIKKDEHDFVICLNLLHFLTKKNIKKIISEIKSKITKNGVIILSAFTDKDPSFKVKKNKKKKIKYYFKKNELLNEFKDFECLYYFDGIIMDLGHAGKEYPHKHGIANIITRKK